MIAKIAEVKSKIIRNQESSRYDVKVKAEINSSKIDSTAKFISIRLCKEGIRYLELKGVGNRAKKNMDDIIKAF